MKEDKIILFLSVITFLIYFVLYINGIYLVGVGQDGEYFTKDNRRIVVGVKKEEEETVILFNEYGELPNTAISKKLFKIDIASQVLPPNYIAILDNEKFLVSAWFHTGFAPDILQNFALGIHLSAETIRILNTVFLTIFILSFFLSIRLWFDKNSAWISTSLTPISSAFFFFSISGLTCGRYYFVALSFAYTSFLFASLFVRKKRTIHLILSAIFSGLSISSYFRGGMIFSFVIGIFILVETRKISHLISFFLISLIFFLPTIIFWIAFFGEDKILPHPTDPTVFKIFPRTGLKFILESMKEEINISNIARITMYDLLSLSIILNSWEMISG